MDLVEAGVASGIVILILREVFGFLKTYKAKDVQQGAKQRRADDNAARDSQMVAVVSAIKDLTSGIHEQAESLKEIAKEQQRQAREITDLHKWHDREDDDGVKLWYVRASLEKAIVDLSNNIKAQTDVLQNLFHEQKAMGSELHDIREARVTR